LNTCQRSMLWGLFEISARLGGGASAVSDLS
jgi:hypothetical protein